MKERKFDRIYRALGDVHRIEILDILMQGERNAQELLEMVDVAQSTLSHHMKTLTGSGLVSSRRSGKWTCYSVNAETVNAAKAFLDRYLNPEILEKLAAEAAAAPEQKVEEKPKARPRRAVKKASEKIEEPAATLYAAFEQPEEPAKVEESEAPRAKKDKSKDKEKDKSKKKDKKKDKKKEKKKSGKKKES